MTLYLDGYPNLNLDIRKSQFCFDPSLNDPIVEIVYGGHGKRSGNLSYYEVGSVKLIFRDQTQMRDFVVATTTTPEPDKQFVHVKTVTGKNTETNEQQSTGGPDIWPFVALGLAGITVAALMDGS